VPVAGTVEFFKVIVVISVWRSALSPKFKR
jgi:hypothetical protein